MKRLVWFLILAAAIGLGFKYIPAETRQKALASIGLEKFLRETAPNYLRQKLSIPEDPITKRKKILDQVAARIEAAQLELEELAPADAKGASGPVSPRLVREKAEAIRDLLGQTQAVVGELQELNPQGGILQEAAERILDKVLPLPAVGGATAQDGARGIDGPCQCSRP